MNLADWLILAVIGLSVAVAAAQGFIYEIFSLAGVVAGYIAAAWGYKSVAAWFAPWVKMPWVADIAGFLTIFVLVVMLAGAVAKLLRWGVSKGGLRWFDRFLGGVFGLLRGMLVVTVVLVAAGSWTPQATWLAESQIAPYLLIVGRAAVWVAPGEVRTQYQHGMQQLRQLRSPQKAQGTGK